MSEGEEYIADFLDSENIKYEAQARIHALKNDLKQHRDADFYLPQYEVYIEFFGQWNIESQKPRYRDKKKIYKLNKIPCVILYPENLGIIEYVFHKRLINEFKKYKLKNALLKYRLYELWKDRNENLILLFIGCLIFYSAYPWSVKRIRERQFLEFLSSFINYI